ncbi:hypothetical protein, partial [Escherichia coli]|uniref:hypothetical protein n=1 Tax=Escherichia coli TaxID=562 RepID=UPI00333CC6D2
WEKQKGSRGIRRGQWYRLVFQFPIREPVSLSWVLLYLHLQVLQIFNALVLTVNSQSFDD